MQNTFYATDILHNRHFMQNTCYATDILCKKGIHLPLHREHPYAGKLSYRNVLCNIHFI